MPERLIEPDQRKAENLELTRLGESLSVGSMIGHYPQDQLVVLFRGLRNSQSAPDGEWWTDDAFYALTCGGGGIMVSVLPQREFSALIASGKVQDETDHEGRKYAVSLLTHPYRRMTFVELAVLKEYVKISRIGAAMCVRCSLSMSDRLKHSRAAIFQD